MLSQSLKWDNGVGTPTISNQYRKYLKCVTVVLENHLKSNFLHEALLGTESKIKLKIREDENSIEDKWMPNARISDNENEVETDKEPLKWVVENNLEF